MAIAHLKIDYKLKNALSTGDHINGVHTKKNYRTSMESKIAINKREHYDGEQLEKIKNFGDNESTLEESLSSSASDEIKVQADIQSVVCTHENEPFLYTSSQGSSAKTSPSYLMKKSNNILKAEDSSFVLEDRMKSLSLSEIRTFRGVQQKRPLRKNMSFTNNEIMKIERDNEILLSRIMAQQKSQKTKGQTPIQPRMSSSAINRKKQQRKIDEDNMILLRRLQGAKPCIDNKSKIQGYRNTQL